MSFLTPNNVDEKCSENKLLPLRLKKALCILNSLHTATPNFANKTPLDMTSNISVVKHFNMAVLYKFGLKDMEKSKIIFF